MCIRDRYTPLSSLGHPSPLVLRTKDQRSQLLHSWKHAYLWLEILVNRAILQLDSSGLEIVDICYIRTVPSSQFVSPLGSSTSNELLLKFPLNHCTWHVRDNSEWSMTWHGDSVTKAREILCHMMLGYCQVVLCNELCLSRPWTVQVASLLEFIYLQMPLHLLYPQDFGFLYFISTQRSSNPFFPADIVNEPFDIGGDP